jgi:alcohol dehydrogenase, propanol-preferring
VRHSLVLGLCVAVAFSASPALAFKNIAGCDIVTFADQDSPIALAPAHWQTYRDSVATILGAAPEAEAPIAEWRALVNRLIEAQETLLAPEKNSQADRDYVASDSCLALAKLDASAVDSLLGEAQSAPEPIATALRRVTQAARLQIDNIERSARLRSDRAKTPMAAQYYCFVAGAIVALLPPERQQTVTLESFGTTIPCWDTGRTGQRRRRPALSKRGHDMAIPSTMQAMVLDRPGEPLRLARLKVPKPGPDQILIKVAACGVCRTDLHIADGELPHPKLPLVLGHEIVGRVAALGDSVEGFAVGDRVGVPWLGSTDGTCFYCRRGEENLCDDPRFTGYQIDGGYAEYTVADARYAFKLPQAYSDAEAAPLLCAGLIGYRALKLAGKPLGGKLSRLGIYGFGAAAHIVAQVAKAQGCEVYAFTRPGDVAAQEFARKLGAVWAGGSDEMPPERLGAAIIFAPVGALVPAALKAVRKGGVVVSGGIHMSDIPSFSYDILWEERVLRSVANLTRADAREFLALAPKIPVKTSVTPMPLSQANEALTRLRKGELTGAAVLVP